VIEVLTRALTCSPVPVLAVLAVDLPGVTPTALAANVDRARERGLSVVPRVGGQHQPLAAAWHRSALPTLHAAAGRGDSLQAVCRRLAEQGLLEEREPPAHDAVRISANLNTPEDLVRWHSLLAEASGAGSGGMA
jgi:molybdopterin-guanine dinucleotide biosynthesis protein A